MAKEVVALVGLGEIGKPLFEILSENYDVIGVDISPSQRVEPVKVLHICYPFQIPDFIGETAKYIAMFQPDLTVINSTVKIGTTRAIAERTGTAVVNSPVRGKHIRMRDELKHYVKFIGATNEAAADKAVCHFESAGMKTKVLSSPEATELAKLTETTYFGILIAWAQEVERYCDQAGVEYDEVVSIFDEVRFFPPVKYLPGIIGGHCVMPNIELLGQYKRSAILEAIKESNEMKAEREARINAVVEV